MEVLIFLLCDELWQIKRWTINRKMSRGHKWAITKKYKLPESLWKNISLHLKCKWKQQVGRRWMPMPGHHTTPWAGAGSWVRHSSRGGCGLWVFLINVLSGLWSYMCTGLGSTFLLAHLSHIVVCYLPAASKVDHHPRGVFKRLMGLALTGFRPHYISLWC